MRCIVSHIYNKLYNFMSSLYNNVSSIFSNRNIIIHIVSIVMRYLSNNHIINNAIMMKVKHPFNNFCNLTLLLLVLKNHLQRSWWELKVNSMKSQQNIEEASILDLEEKVGHLAIDMKKIFSRKVWIHIMILI